MVELKNINYEDPDVWDLFQRGKTIGVFQCESKLVQDWLRKIKPRNLWDLSAVVAIVRPGAASLSEQFVKNRNNPTSVESFGNPRIDDILAVTNNIILYQESLYHLARKIAWADLEENAQLIKADELRKAVGKKDQAKILSIGREFANGCIKNGLSADMAEKLFSVIKDCGRYLFNLSHSFKYGKNAYQMGWIKYHHPQIFYVCSLNFSQEKMHPEEEVHDLVQDAKANGFEFTRPNINRKNLLFTIGDNDKQINFGLNYIKFSGNFFTEIIENLPPIKTWGDVLRFGNTDAFGKKCRSNTLKSLACVGAFDDCGVDRKILLGMINFCECLTERELKYMFEKVANYPNYEDLHFIIADIAANVCNKKRRLLMDSENEILKTITLKDKSDAAWIEEKEKELLGTIISRSAIHEKEKYSSHTCYQLNQISKEDRVDNIILMCVIDSVTPFVIKSGKNIGKEMAKVSVHDSTGEIRDIPVFAQQYYEFRDAITEKNRVQVMMRHFEGRGFVANAVTDIT